MLLLMHHQRIHLAVKPIDFRQGMNRLIALSEHVLGHDPFSGHLFVFRNRRATALKLLTYDGTGFWLCTKRFSSGQLAWWPNKLHHNLIISADQLHLILKQQPLTDEAVLPTH